MSFPLSPGKWNGRMILRSMISPGRFKPSGKCARLCLNRCLMGQADIRTTIESIIGDAGEILKGDPGEAKEWQRSEGAALISLAEMV